MLLWCPEPAFLVFSVTVVILLTYLILNGSLISIAEIRMEPGPSHCGNCGMLKSVLKQEILNEILPFITDMIVSARAQPLEAIHCNSDLPQNNLPADKPNIQSQSTLGFDGYIDSEISIINERVSKLETLASVNLASYIQARDDFQAQITNLRLDCADEFDEVSSKLSTLNEGVKEIDNDITQLYLKAEEQQQYTRRHILELHGCTESRNENTTDIALDIFQAIGVPVERMHISRSHRQRKGRRNGRPRPIYVQFISHDIRDEVYNARHLLRDIPGLRKVFINENLTRLRSWLYSCVRRECKRNFYHWTYDGIIYVSKDGSYKNAESIIYKSDFMKVFGKAP